MKSITVALLSFLCILAHSQQPSDAPTFAGPQLYLELYGSSATYSINAEHLIFKTKRWYTNGRLGFGYFKRDEIPFYSIPAGLNFFNKQGNHHVELGIGLSFIQGMSYYFRGGVPYFSKSIFAAPVLGYRFQKPTGGVFFKVLFTPLYKVKEYAHDPWFNTIKKGGVPFGVGVGYFFSRK